MLHSFRIAVKDVLFQAHIVKANQVAPQFSRLQPARVVNEVDNKESMLISSGYGIFFNRQIKELMFDRWSSGKFSKLWNNSDSTHADPQIYCFVILGE